MLEPFKNLKEDAPEMDEDLFTHGWEQESQAHCP